MHASAIVARIFEMERRVVVTGMGLISPVGNTVDEAWRNILQGKCGVGPITLFDASSLPVAISAQVKDFDPSVAMSAKEIGRNPRFIQFAIAAAKQAMEDAGFTSAFEIADRSRWGCCIGVGLGSIEDIEQNAYILRDKGAKRVSPFFIPLTIPNMAAGLVAERFGLQGPNMCTATACASGSHGIGEGFLYIKGGLADVMLCGGAESTITPLTIAAFSAMKALSRRNHDPLHASRPFDLERDGFVMGEGAGLLALEEYEHAKARGARIYAEVVGYGLTGDAHHMTSPAPDGEGGRRCMDMALQMGGGKVECVDYINAHGTSTRLNDEYESTAINRVFGEHAKKVAVSSTKGATGHCIGAAGGIEAIFTIKAINDAIMPPTINYEAPDPGCSLDYVPNEPRRREIRYALSNSFGFGGVNASLLFRQL